MSLHFILDGYNIVRGVPELLGRAWVDLHACRERFIQYLSSVRPQGRANNRVTVVFDGYVQMKADWDKLHREKIEIVFSEEASADDRIVQLAGKATRPKETVVVTSDRELSQRVRKLDVKVIPVKTFMVQGSPKRTRKGSVRAEGKKKLSLEQEQKITKELERLWLKKT